MEMRMRNILLSAAVKDFVRYKRAEGISESTIVIYMWTFDRMIDFLGDRVLETIQPSDIQDFYLWLRTDYQPNRKNGDTSSLKPSSVEKAWSSIRSFYNWSEKILKIERADRTIKRPRYGAKEIAPFTEEDIQALLRACMFTKPAATNSRKSFMMHRDTAARDVAIILVLLDTGLRVSECARLKVKDVDLVTGEVFVDAFGTGQKTQSRHIYLGKQAIRALNGYLLERGYASDNDPLFATRRGDAMNKNSIRLLLSELGKRAGVDNTHPHRFRHTFAIQYLRNGGDVFTLQRLLGHRSLEMVQHYLALATGDVKEAHNKSSPADRWKLKF